MNIGQTPSFKNATAETPTPRTDAEALNHDTRLPKTTVSADFARDLERELAALRSDYGQLRNNRDGLVGELGKHKGEHYRLLGELTAANARIAHFERELSTAQSRYAQKDALAALDDTHAKLDAANEWNERLKLQLQAALDDQEIATDAVTEAGARELVLRGALERIIDFWSTPAELFDRPRQTVEVARGALEGSAPPVVRREVAEALADSLSDMLGTDRHDSELQDKAHRALTAWEAAKP